MLIYKLLFKTYIVSQVSLKQYRGFFIYWDWNRGVPYSYNCDASQSQQPTSFSVGITFYIR